MSDAQILTSQKESLTTQAKIQEIAAILDHKGAQTAPIRVNCTRSHLMKLGFKPRPRGGEIFCGSHKLVCKPDGHTKKG